MNLKSDEEGSIYLFGIGLGIVALLLLTTSINIAAMWVTRSKLDSVADGAVLAATNSVDIGSIYEGGIDQPININASLATQKVSNYLRLMSASSGLTDLRLENLSINGNEITVGLKAKSDLPFGYLLIGMDSTVKAAAKGALLLR